MAKTVTCIPNLPEDEDLWLNAVWRHLWMMVLPRAIAKESPLWLEWSLNVRPPVLVPPFGEELAFVVELPDEKFVNFHRMFGIDRLSPTAKHNLIVRLTTRLTILMENIDRCAEGKDKIPW